MRVVQLANESSVSFRRYGLKEPTPFVEAVETTFRWVRTLIVWVLLIAAFMAVFAANQGNAAKVQILTTEMVKIEQEKQLLAARLAVASRQARVASYALELEKSKGPIEKLLQHNEHSINPVAAVAQSNADFYGKKLSTAADAVSSQYRTTVDYYSRLFN